MKELGKGEAIETLAEAFSDPDAAAELLDRIEYPRGRRPAFRNPMQFWREVCLQIERGIVAGGLENLWREAASILPHHPVFGAGNVAPGPPGGAGATITWLHLSDLHCCAARTGWDADRVLYALRKDLEELKAVHGLQPDLIFFTGDAAFGNLPNLPIEDQFEEAGTFFEGIRGLYDVPVENVFLVPGNHDVHRGEISGHDTEWLDARLKTYGLDEVVGLIQAGGKDWRNVMERLATYRKFLEGAGYTHLLQDPDRLIYAHRRTIAGVDVAVSGLNSAWSCGRDLERGKLWLAGDYQIATLDPKIRGAAISIGLVHHPLSWFSEAEDPTLGPIFERTFDFHLHGHEHQAWVTSLQGGNVRVAAGACYERSDKPNGYNLVRLDLGRRRGEVWLRRYHKAGGAWVQDVTPGRTDANGVWPLENLRCFA